MGPRVKPEDDDFVGWRCEGDGGAVLEDSAPHGAGALVASK